MNTIDQHGILEKCRQLDLEAKYDESIKLLTDAISRSPAAILYYERGCRLEEIGQNGLAKEDYTRAIQNEPLSKYLIARGYLLSNRLSDSELGLRDFQQALTIDPKNPTVHLNLALCNLLLGKRQDALDSARQAVLLAPMDGMAYVCLGECLLAADQPNDAAEVLQIATSLDPDSANTWSILARTLRKMKKLPEAKACIERAIELDRSAGYLISYASLLLDLNEPLHAITVLQEAQRMDLTEAQGLLVDGYLGRGNRMLREKGAS